jgi:hypothetical protein
LKIIRAGGGDGDACLAEFWPPLFAADKNLQPQAVRAARQFNLNILLLIARLERADAGGNLAFDRLPRVVAVGLAARKRISFSSYVLAWLREAERLNLRGDS